MKCALFVALGLVAAFHAVQASAGPVDKVVDLLKDLKARIESDGETEQTMYDKYACWCEKTSDRKAQAITKAQDDLRDLGQLILKLKGKVATLMAEIAELTAKIKENEAAQAEATSIRQKENEEFMAETTEMKDVLRALGRAIVVLRDGVKKDAFLQETSRARSAVSAVVQALPITAAAKFNGMSLLREFASAHAGAKYTPQSASIQGILKDMFDTFSGDLESTTELEAKRNKNFEEFIAEKQQELSEMKELVSEKKQQKAEAEAMLADSTQEYDDTEAQLKADIKFFDEMKEGCEAKHEEWAERSKMRKMELEGISKALELLTSDEARELFAKSIKEGKETNVDESKDSGVKISLVQLSGGLPAGKAYEALKASAKTTHSLRLASLAARLHETKAGHFDEVIEAIDKIIAELKEEAVEDMKKRDQCLDEYQKIESTVKETEWLIEKNEAKIEKLESLIEKLNKEKEDTLEAIEQVKEDIKAMKKTRKEENEEFLQAKKDDQDAIKLLVEARKFLKDYYEKNKIPLGKVQDGSFVQQGPEFEVPEDQAPDADFSGKGSRKGEAKGIVSMMTMIIEDLNDEIKNAMTAEEKAQLAFEKQLASAEALQEDLEKKVVTLEKQIAKKELDLSEEEKDLANNKDDLQKELDYKKEIEPDCDWIIGAFEKRAEMRTAEMDGLVQAKEFLAGASTEEASLVQKVGKHISNEKTLASVEFVGLR